MNPLGQRLTDALALRSSYRTVFDEKSIPAKRVLRHLMKVGYITRTPFVGGDSHETALNLGAQRLVQSLLKYIYSDDDAIRRAIEESHQQEEP